MKRKAFIAVLAVPVLFTLLSACADTSETPTPGEGEILVYRIRGDVEQTGGELIIPEIASLPEDANKLEAAIESAVGSAASPELLGAFPQGTRLTGYELESGELSVGLNVQYLLLEGAERSVADYCLTLTLCQFDEVSSVSIYVNGQAESLGLLPDDALLYDAGAIPTDKEIRLYFMDESGRYLSPERRVVTMEEGEELERRVMTELLAGPESANLYGVIPEGTEFAIFTDENSGLCTVDFSGEFLLARPYTAQEERQVIYSIVNTLTSLPGVESVRIRVQGRPGEIFRYLSISQPIERAEYAIGPPNAAKGETDINVYMALGDGAHLMAVPRIVTSDEYQSPAHAAVEALFTGEGGSCLKSLFTPDDFYNEISVYDDICKIDLPKSFFTSRGENPHETRLAVDALVATLTDLDGINAVELLIDGESAVYGQLDLTGQLRKNTDVIVN